MNQETRNNAQEWLTANQRLYAN